MTDEEKEELYKEFKERLIDDLISNLKLSQYKDWGQESTIIELIFKTEDSYIHLGEVNAIG